MKLSQVKYYVRKIQQCDTHDGLTRIGSELTLEKEERLDEEDFHLFLKALNKREQQLCIRDYMRDE